MPEHNMPHEITTFFHCKKCILERPNGTSPRDWARFEVGWTVKGLQVRCVRHDVNVLHIDFQGMKHPADMSDEGDFKLREVPKDDTGPAVN